METIQGGEGPYFDELAVGQEFSWAPAVTLTGGLAAAHQAVTGSRLPLVLDRHLCAAVTGGGPLAPPDLVWGVSIGQSSIVTQHVKANLFYRGLAFRRLPLLGDTLRTVTTITGLRQNRSRPGRAPTGLAALRITTTDQEGRPVLDFWRCAMLPLRDQQAQTGAADDLDAIGAGAPGPACQDLVGGWDLAPLAARASAAKSLAPGTVIDVAGGDVVSSAPELARLTVNVAAVHHDAAAGGGQRLVYGGHTIALALAQASRALPSLVTVAGWEGCDHTGPVREGDTLRSVITVEQADPLPGGAILTRLRSQVRADSPDGPPARDVLDWRFTAILA